MSTPVAIVEVLRRDYLWKNKHLKCLKCGFSQRRRESFALKCKNKQLKHILYDSSHWFNSWNGFNRPKAKSVQWIVKQNISYIKLSPWSQKILVFDWLYIGASEKHCSGVKPNCVTRSIAAIAVAKNGASIVFSHKF